MKAVMISLRLWWFYLIYKGIKKLEIRKSYPKNFQGFVFAYVCKTNWQKDLMKIPEEERDFFIQFIGKVGLKFTLNKVEHFEYETLSRDISGYWLDNGKVFNLKGTCLIGDELWNYIKSGNGYAWHIDNVVPFDKPKELKEFNSYCEFSLRCLNCKYYWTDDSAGYSIPMCSKCLTKAPQSWFYVEV